MKIKMINCVTASLAIYMYTYMYTYMYYDYYSFSMIIHILPKTAECTVEFTYDD